MNLPKLKVGDRVILIEGMRYGGKSEGEATVTKIGRKWGEVQHPRFPSQSYRFDLVTGWCDGKGYSPNERVTTLEIREDEKRRAALVARLTDYDLGFRRGNGSAFSTAMLEELVAVCDKRAPIAP